MNIYNTNEINNAYERVAKYFCDKSINYFKGFVGKPLEVSINKKIRFVKFSLQTTNSFHLDAIHIFDENSGNKIETSTNLISSSFQDNENCSGLNILKRVPNGGCGFHTKNETCPWICLDLGKEIEISKIVIFNRSNIHYKRALSLKIDTSSDLSEWTQIYDNFYFINNYKYPKNRVFEKAFVFAKGLDATVAASLLNKMKSEGFHDEAIHLFNLINEFVKDTGLALAPHGGFNETFSLSSETKKKKLYNELSSLLRLINEEFKSPAFISSGTLLGIVRDGDFIGHDDDLDICYICNESNQDKIIQHRQSLINFLEIHGYIITKSKVAHVLCRTPSGFIIDIFTGFIEGEYCSMNPISRKKILAHNVLPLNKLKLKEEVLYLPSSPDLLLIENYGINWKKPDPLWKFDWINARKQFEFLYFKDEK